MKRLVLVIALFVATSAFADNYSDGVAAVQARDYSAAVQLLQRAITEAPVETPGYLPHYWIGIARFNLGDIDGALRHWRISQDQGAIAKTSERGKLVDWIAKAQAEKQRRASADPDAAKKAADAAISRALAKQGEAISRGRDRSDSYRTAARKLQDANAEFRKGGYGAAQKLAEDAQALFAGTAPIVVPFDDEPKIESAAHAEAAVALQNFRRRTLKNSAATREWERLRKELDRAKNDADVERIAAAIKKADEGLNAPPKPAAETAAATQKQNQNLEKAYRAFAAGDLETAEQLLTKIIDATPTAEAFLLRGCARYTRAVLTRGDDRDAAADLAEALHRDGELKLDDSAFSPKLISFFEKVRRSR